MHEHTLTNSYFRRAESNHRCESEASSIWDGRNVKRGHQQANGSGTGPNGWSAMSRSEGIQVTATFLDRPDDHGCPAESRRTGIEGPCAASIRTGLEPDLAGGSPRLRVRRRPRSPGERVIDAVEPRWRVSLGVTVPARTSIGILEIRIDWMQLATVGRRPPRF